MQRLVLAILIVAALAALLVVIFTGLRRAISSGPGLPAQERSEPLQKIAFALLIGLIAYAALMGGG